MSWRDLCAAAAALVLLAGVAEARTDVTTRPGPFKGYTTSTIRQDNGPVATCITRPGPFKGQRTTTCQ